MDISTMLEARELTALIEGAEDEGVVDAHALEAVALELELDDEELAALRAELETRGVEAFGGKLVVKAFDAGQFLDIDQRQFLHPFRYHHFQAKARLM